MFKNPDYHTEPESATAHISVEILEYIPNAVLNKTVIRKTNGNISVTALDAGKELSEKESPFDTFIQIVEGSVQVVIRDRNYKLRLGEGIIIPANASHCFRAMGPFKMVSTTINNPDIIH